ncbi:MAG: hypothetical protein WCI61_06340 [Chloroflexota bacterium]
MPGGRVARILGWVVALNALAILGATALPVPVREAAGRFALWCGLG